MTRHRESREWAVPLQVRTSLQWVMPGHAPRRALKPNIRFRYEVTSVQPRGHQSTRRDTVPVRLAIGRWPAADQPRRLRVGWSRLCPCSIASDGFPDSHQADAASDEFVSGCMCHHETDPICLNLVLNVVLSQFRRLVRNSDRCPCPDRYERKRLSFFAEFYALRLEDTAAARES